MTDQEITNAIKDCPIFACGKRVIVKDVDMSITTASGIMLQDKHRDDCEHAVVLSVGPEVSLVTKLGPPKQILKPGDLVAYNKTAGLRIREGGKEYFIIYELDVFGIINKEAYKDKRIEK